MSSIAIKGPHISGTLVFLPLFVIILAKSYRDGMWETCTHYQSFNFWSEISPLSAPDLDAICAHVEPNNSAT